METSVLNEETSVLNGEISVLNAAPFVLNEASSVLDTESSVLNGEISVLSAPMAAFCEAVDAESGAGSVKVDESLKTTEEADEKNGRPSPPTGGSQKNEKTPGGHSQ